MSTISVRLPDSLHNMVRGQPGLVGWFGFECIEYIEPCLRANPLPDELGTPDILLMLSEEVAVFDNLKGRLYLIVHADPREAQAWARANRRRPDHARPCPLHAPPRRHRLHARRGHRGRHAVVGRGAWTSRQAI